MEYKRREVKRGYWYYDEILKKGVAIIAINYDYWYEIDKADGFDVTDQHPVLNENGESFLIEWYDAEFKTKRKLPWCRHYPRGSHKKSRTDFRKKN